MNGSELGTRAAAGATGSDVAETVPLPINAPPAAVAARPPRNIRLVTMVVVSVLFARWGKAGAASRDAARCNGDLGTI